ncbi:DUF3242 domain-containing protein [Thermosipho atlanticus]|uniref:DUF3242 domain-containing protein n=1 Tax=Thermosipho atlanticus DSM 15807 TaxID=1123380 RepID=A0A1M5SHE8_9BACT|nr:DUF3242 domain-containing protein [Thermosipho atlanticus]SHH37830.1 Protein of unknown function [Thermosipho atlanticus DSM 15807]
MLNKLFIVLVVIVLLTSCTMIFKTPVPNGSASLKNALFVLDGKYELKEYGYINSVFNVDLGEGIYGIFNNYEGMLYIFKYDSPEITKVKWKTFIKTFGNPLKINYVNLNFFDRGYLKTNFEGIKIISWWKDKWIFILSGKKPEDFLEYINTVYEMVNI